MAGRPWPLGQVALPPALDGLEFDHAAVGAEYVDAHEIEIAAPVANEDELLAMHEALDALAAHDARKAELVKLRSFIGLSIAEAAEGLHIPAPTAKRDWTYAAPGSTA